MLVVYVNDLNQFTFGIKEAENEETEAKQLEDIELRCLLIFGAAPGGRCSVSYSLRSLAGLLRRAAAARHMLLWWSARTSTHTSSSSSPPRAHFACLEEG